MPKGARGEKRSLSELEKQRIAEETREKFLKGVPGTKITAIYVHTITDDEGEPRVTIECEPDYDKLT